MTDSGIMFWLILSALTLVIIGMFLMVCMMLMGDREKRRNLPPGKECTHFLGYLSGHPRTQAIPDECFGCSLAIDCIKAAKQKEVNTAREEITVEMLPQQ